MTIMGGATNMEFCAMTISTKPYLFQQPTADEAIAFALDHLEPFEVADFLSEWREGKDLGPWLAALYEDQKAATAG